MCNSTAIVAARDRRPALPKPRMFTGDSRLSPPNSKLSSKRLVRQQWLSALWPQLVCRGGVSVFGSSPTALIQLCCVLGAVTSHVVSLVRCYGSGASREAPRSRWAGAVMQREALDLSCTLGFNANVILL